MVKKIKNKNLCVAEKSNGESVMLCAATDEERKEWMKALTYHIYSGRGGGNFVQTNLNVMCLHEMSWKSPVCISELASK